MSADAATKLLLNACACTQATCRFSGMEVVLKIYNGVDKAPDVAQHEMYREVAIQSGLQHPNVVHLFGAFEVSLEN